jgi:hypothetical protein
MAKQKRKNEKARAKLLKKNFYRGNQKISYAPKSKAFRGQENIKVKKENKKIQIGKRKNLNIIIFFVLAILFSVALTEIAYLLYKIQYVKVFDAKLEVGDVVGFAVGKQELNFGIVPAGGAATRYLTAENQGNKDIMAEILVTGCIKKFIFYENYATIKPNETKQFSFQALIPEGTKEGKCTGKIFLIFKRI